MAASLTLSGAVLAADGKTLTATISGGTGTGYGVASTAGLVPRITAGNGWCFYLTGASVLGTTLTMLLATPIAAGEVAKIDIEGVPTVTDDGGNTLGLTTNIAVTNNSAVTVRTITVGADEFEVNGATTASQISNVRWGGDRWDFYLETVVDATEIAMLCYSGQVDAAAIDSAARSTPPSNGFWSAKPLTLAPLAAGKHFVGVEPGQYFYGLRISGGARTVHCVPTAKQAMIPYTAADEAALINLPDSGDITNWGAWKPRADGTWGQTNIRDGYTVEFGFVGSGVEMSTIAATWWAVSVDDGQPGDLVTTQDAIAGPLNEFQLMPLCKGLPAGAHTIHALLTGTFFNTFAFGCKVINGTKITASSAIGDIALTVASAATLTVGDWVKIDDGTIRERRKVEGIAGNVVTVAPLTNAHAAGATVTSYAAPAGSFNVHIRRDLSGGRDAGLGDSNTEGFNDYGAGGIPDADGNEYGFYDTRTTGLYKAALELGREYVNLGIQGTDTVNQAARINEVNEFTRGSVDRVFIWPGTNDINSGVVTPAGYKANVQTMITGAVPYLRPDGLVVLMPPGTPAGVTSATGLSIEVCKAKLLELAEENLSTICLEHMLDDLDAGDLSSLHYHISGQDKIGEAIVAEFAEAGGVGSLFLITGAGAETPLAFSTI